MDARPPVRYRSHDEDSGRWIGFPFRPGDIVISTRSKCGTTWMQMICALLVFGSRDLPAPLRELSPWLDWTVAPRDEVWGDLERQQHRRFIKSHTPLDGIPVVPSVTYVVVAREPIDAAVSLHHQGANLDRRLIAELTGQPDASSRRPPLRDWLQDWMEWDGDPGDRLDSLVGTIAHLDDAFRRDDPNIVLVHYDDLLDDLEGEMQRLASVLSIDVPEARWPGLVEAAGFDAMRARPELSVPGPPGVLRDPAAFFRRGSSGEAAALLDHGDLSRYEQRLTALASPGLRTWLRDAAIRRARTTGSLRRDHVG